MYRIIFSVYFFFTLLLYSKMHWLDMSNIARQYIHVSYTDVLFFFIVTTFTLNIFYIICYLDNTTPTSHRAHSASGRIQSRDEHQLLLQLPFQQCARFACTHISVRAKVKMKTRHVRYLHSFSFLQKLTKSDPPVNRHTARHTEDEEELAERLWLAKPGIWDMTTESNEQKKEPTLHILNQLRACLRNK